MAASSDSHCSILNSQERLAGFRGEIRKIDWGSVGEFRPYERFVSHNDSFFLRTGRPPGAIDGKYCTSRTSEIFETVCKTRVLGKVVPRMQLGGSSQLSTGKKDSSPAKDYQAIRLYRHCCFVPPPSSQCVEVVYVLQGGGGADRGVKVWKGYETVCQKRSVLRGDINGP